VELKIGWGRERVNVGFSKDGSAGGGTYAGFSAVLWTAGLGMRSVKTELESYGIDLTGWYLTGATGVTNDGRTIVGRGVNPRGFEEAWIATVPEPSTMDNSTRPSAANRG